MSLQRIEAVVLDRLDQLRLEAAHIGGGAEGAVVHVAAGAAGDLRQLDIAQRAQAAAVEFAQRREPDMVHIHVEAHADGVGRDQVVDLARLVEVDLGVARARAQGAHHHRRAAALAADQLGDGIDLAGREGDHGRAARQARHLLGAGIGELGKARPRHDLGVGQQAVQHRADGLGAQQHGLLRAARVQQPVGEDVAALGIGASWISSTARNDTAVERHGFDGADEIARAGRGDLLLAGDQRHLRGALDLHDAVVVLARQQAQREADHARCVAEHALDGEMGLAGVGGTEDGGQAAGGAGKRHRPHLRPRLWPKQGRR